MVFSHQAMPPPAIQPTMRIKRTSQPKNISAQMVMKLPKAYKSESRRWRLTPAPDQFADKSLEHKKTRPKRAGFSRILLQQN
jgi:hypothetical protein